MSDDLALLYAMVNGDGRRWGDVATDWQRADAAAVLNRAGRRRHFQTRPRGGGKTTDQAGTSLVVLIRQAPPGARMYWIAVDAEQAAIGHDAATGFVRRTPGLSDEVQVLSNQIRNRRNGATLQVLPADGASSWGLLPYWVCVDEIGQWPSTRNHRELWTAVVSSMPKVPESRLVVLTSAGDPAHWSARVLAEVEKSPQWRVAQIPGPLSWRTEEDLAEQRSLLTESEFARLHLNQWTAPEDRLTTVDAVMRCVSDRGTLRAVKGVKYVVSLDVGLVNDATVITVGHRRANDDSSVAVVLDRIDVFQGTKAKPVDLVDVEAHIAELCTSYNNAEVIVDPFQAVHLSQGLRRRGLRVREFIFSQSSTGRLGLQMYHLLKDGLFDLPNDEALIEELSNVRLRETAPGSYRLDHDSGKHDDRAVALALLAHQLLEQPRHRRRSMVGFSGSSGEYTAVGPAPAAQPSSSSVGRYDAARLAALHALGARLPD